MKKLNYFLLGLAGLTMASCSQDDLLGTKGEGNCHLIVNLPSDLATRATTPGDALTANNLYIAIYDQDNELIEVPAVVSFNGQISTNVNLNLVAGQTYQIALFAAAPQAVTDEVYVFDPTNGVINVNYSNMGYEGTNLDQYDCFYKLQEITVGTTELTETVMLTRPIAKINWGTSDLDNNSVKKAFGENGEFLETTVQIKEAYNQFSLLDSDVVEGKTTPVTFTGWAVPQGWTFPEVSETTEYQYIAQQFVLAPASESTTYDLSLTADNKLNVGATPFTNSLIVSSAPVEANYQTNIYGSLLTDNVNFTVTKDKEWNTPDFNVAIGSSEPELDDDGFYMITDQAELKWVADQVNGTATATLSTRAATNPQSIQFKLMNDVYMVGNWTPIGIDFAHRFNGTFKGQDYTIYNLTVNTNDRTGFFGFMNGVVENVNFSNATIISNHWAGVVAGFSDNETGSAIIRNCNVSNSSVTLSPEQINGKWDNGDKGGLIIGYMVTKDQVTGCSVSNCTLTGYRDLGGIIGYANGSVITNNKVNGLTISVNKAQNYEGYTTDSQYDANPVIGQFVQGTYGQDSGNTNEGVNISYGIFATSNDILSAAISGAQAGETITIQKGTYTFPSVSDFKNPGIVLDCEEGTVFEGATNFGYAGGKYGINGATVKNATFSNNSGTAVQGYLNGNFDNCKFVGENATRWTYLSGPTKFTNCTFDSAYEGYGFHVDSKVAASADASIQFEGCDLEGFVAIGGGVPTEFTGCTFTSNGAYGGGNFYATTSFTDCKFFLANQWANGVFEYIRLYSSSATYTFNNCTNNGEAITLDYNFRAVKGATLIVNGQTLVFDQNVNT